MKESQPLSAVLLTLLAGLAGGVAFFAAGLPAPWLSGAMIGTVALMVLGMRPALPDPARDVGMLLAGCVTGSSITREMLAVLGHYPVSLLLLALTTAGVVFGGAWLLRRLFGWDPHSAFFASAPGALSVVVAGVAERGGDMARVVAAQAFRLLILVALLPSVIMQFMAAVPPPRAALLAAPSFALVAGSGFLLGLLARRVHLMAPWFLGGMAGAAGLHLGGVVVGTPPGPVGNLSMLLVGIFAASRMVGTRFAVLRQLWLPCLSLFLCSTAIALVGGLAAHVIGGVPLAEALVAFAPGGLEAMVVLGLSLGLDPLYVTSHHVGRFIMLSFALPLFSRRVPGAGPGINAP